MRIASFDIGKCNFAFYIEECNIDELNKTTNVTKQQRYNVDGSPTDKFQETLTNVCVNGDTILFKCLDLTVNCKKSKYLDKQIYVNMYNALNEHKSYFDTCDHIVIEQQMSFGSKHNTMALKLGQHCYSWFIFTYGGTKPVYEFPAFHKTQVLGAPKQVNEKTKRMKAMEKPQRKKWAVEKAVTILEERGDMATLDIILERGKKDDLADTLIQCQSFKYLFFIDKADLN